MRLWARRRPLGKNMIKNYIEQIKEELKKATPKELLDYCGKGIDCLVLEEKERRTKEETDTAKVIFEILNNKGEIIALSIQNVPCAVGNEEVRKLVSKWFSDNFRFSWDVQDNEDSSLDDDINFDICSNFKAYF